MTLTMQFTSCKDDDNTDYVTPVVATDPDLSELLALLKASSDIYVNQDILTSAESGVKNVNYVHYFGKAMEGKLDKNVYKEAFENNHYFLVYESNAEALAGILGYTFKGSLKTKDESVVLSDDTLKQFSTTTSYTQNELLSIEDHDTIDYTHSGNVSYATTPLLVRAKPLHYYLFNKKMEMVVAVPAIAHNPALTVEAMRDAIHKYKADKPSLKSSVVDLENQIIVYSWQFEYAFPSGHQNTQRATATYYIKGCYSYSDDRDYYLVAQEITVRNSQLVTKKQSFKNYHSTSDTYFAYEGFSRGLNLQAVLGAESDGALGAANNTKFHLMQESPQTTTGSASFTTGVSVNIGGNIGVSPTGPSGGISGGVTMSSSQTTSIPDVTVSNYCSTGDNNQKDDDRYTEWQYRIASPRSHSDYLNTGHQRWAIDDVVHIGTTNINYQASHIWAVDNPKNGFNPIIAIRAEPLAGWSAGRQNWVGTYWTWYDYTHPCPGASWYVIKLNPVKRD
ncbi:hypothetical protein FACS1894162_7160 [Bacteroidia bacterium]|nr:hypothetical protein FACS1894162_7160 [Bacteroidia bacterium]